jgi:hypothetical protein
MARTALPSLPMSWALWRSEPWKHSPTIAVAGATFAAAGCRQLSNQTPQPASTASKGESKISEAVEFHAAETTTNPNRRKPRSSSQQVWGRARSVAKQQPKAKQRTVIEWSSPPILKPLSWAHFFRMCAKSSKWVWLVSSE